MPSTQPTEDIINEDPLPLESLKGVSTLFSHEPETAEVHSPKKKDAGSVATGEKDKDKREFKDRPRPPPVLDYQKELVKLINSLSTRRSHWQVFADFCEMSAIALSNAVDFAQREKREERYMQIVRAYNRHEMEQLSLGIPYLTMALENGFSDVLGKTFHDLELHSKWAGQFFTPYDVSRMMAKMTIGDCEDLKERIASRGFVTAQEPAVGSGSMVIALAEAMRDVGVNYQKHLHVTAIDIDPKCVHMAYLQFSLLYIPAIIVHGNTLSLEEYGRWYTPAHIMDGWTWKLRRKVAIEEALEIIAAPPMAETTPAEAVPEPMQEGPQGQLKLF